jgi:hypothetical protein
MANDSTEHSFLGKRYLKNLEKQEAAWLEAKAADAPTDRKVARELRRMRTIYRNKYRPLPVDGVSIGRTMP